MVNTSSDEAYPDMWFVNKYMYKSELLIEFQSLVIRFSYLNGMEKQSEPIMRVQNFSLAFVL